jgi:hypothetical protein
MLHELNTGRGFLPKFEVSVLGCSNYKVVSAKTRSSLVLFYFNSIAISRFQRTTYFVTAM